MTGIERRAASSEGEIPEDFLQKELERIENEVDKTIFLAKVARGPEEPVWWNLWEPEEWVSQYSQDELLAIILQADYVPFIKTTPGDALTFFRSVAGEVLRKKLQFREEERLTKRLKECGVL